MEWIRYSVSQPHQEGWYLVHYSRAADRPGTYWKFWQYRAVYWNPALACWTEDARTPEEGGVAVDVPIDFWTEIFCIQSSS